MPRVSFAEELKTSKVDYNYPKFKLETGEKARISVLEDPLMEYRHSLNSPIVMNGVVQTEKVKQRDGSFADDMVREFVSAPLCLGDADTLATSGLDPETCPMCAYAKAHPERIDPPRPRYAMHVIKYKTKPSSTDLASPFSVELVVWSFTEGVFRKIWDYNKSWEEMGGLKEHDLLITCVAGKYQNLEYSVDPAGAAWSKSDATRDLVKETYKENQLPDLSIACGSRKELAWINDDIKKVDEAWGAVSRAQGSNEPDSTDESSFEEGVKGLLDSPPKAEKPAKVEKKTDESEEAVPAEKPAQTSTNFEDLF